LLPAGAIWPGGACTHWKAPPCHGAHVDRTFIDDRPSHQSGGDFDVARARWIGDYSDPQNFLFLFESGNGKFD
jgi:oligopeptide transport system substrate-binding protein